MCTGANPVRNLTAVKEMEKKWKDVAKWIYACNSILFTLNNFKLRLEKRYEPRHEISNNVAF